MEKGERRKVTDAKARHIYEGIEAKHFGRCVWQARLPDGKTIVECMEYPKAGMLAIVVKEHDGRLPHPESSRPWPELIGVQVYVPVDPNSNEWASLDRELTSFETVQKVLREERQRVAAGAVCTCAKEMKTCAVHGWHDVVYQPSKTGAPS